MSSIVIGVLAGSLLGILTGIVLGYVRRRRGLDNDAGRRR